MTSAAANIAAVERDTGIGKDTLRVWERRYGFPKPERDALGERLYPHDQIERLRLVRRLIDSGHRPGQVVGLPHDALLALAPGPKAAAHAPAALPVAAARTASERPADTGQRPASGAASPAFAGQAANSDVAPLADLATRMAWLRSHDVDALRRHFGQAVAQLGLSRFVQEVVVPMNAQVGDAWLRGDLQIFEEHLYTETVTAVLRHGIHNLPAGAPDRPRVLMTTFPKEPHGLGLLMAEAMLALQGCRCVSLGPQTPVDDIVRAADAQRADAVALSFTGSLNPNYVLSGLKALRTQLAERVEIWVGGQCPVLYRKPLDGVTPLPTFEALASHLRQWHRVEGRA